MSRKQPGFLSALSPVQRKACIVLALCVLAVVLSVVVAWIPVSYTHLTLPTKLEV